MNGNPFHHAFRIVYHGLVKALITDCEIALPSATNPPPKQFSKFKAIWDTGATNSVITENIVKNMSLPPTGMVNTHGVHGESQVNTYIVDIKLPNNVCITDVKVTEGKLLGNIDVLIGMDIIQAGDFAISNTNGKTIFSYCIPPHKNPTDLFEKSEKINKNNHYPTSVIHSPTK